MSWKSASNVLEHVHPSPQHCLRGKGGCLLRKLQYGGKYKYAANGNLLFQLLLAGIVAIFLRESVNSHQAVKLQANLLVSVNNNPCINPLFKKE